MTRQKMPSNRQAGLPAESGFVQVPAIETSNLSLLEELQRLHTVFKQREKLILGVFLTVFLLLLLMLESLQPNLPRNFTLSLLLGLCCGLISGFIRESTDATIKSREMLASILPLPLLGAAPAIGKNAGNYALHTATAPDSPVATAFRTLRNNLLVITQQRPPKIITMTSTDASEGKSSSTINLASSFVQAGYKVLLLDADLRRPTLHKHFGLDNTKGLGNYLAGLDEFEPLVRPTSIDGLHVVTSGPITPHAVELLGSSRLQKLMEHLESADAGYDLIMIDSPPVLGLADALLISNRAHATLMVVACKQARRRPLLAAVARLKQSHTNLVGVVLTKV